jgi:hypothetical protein
VFPSPPFSPPELRDPQFSLLLFHIAGEASHSATSFCFLLLFCVCAPSVLPEHFLVCGAWHTHTYTHTPLALYSFIPFSLSLATCSCHSARKQAPRGTTKERRREQSKEKKKKRVSLCVCVCVLESRDSAVTIEDPICGNQTHFCFPQVRGDPSQAAAFPPTTDPPAALTPVAKKRLGRHPYTEKKRKLTVASALPTSTVGVWGDSTGRASMMFVFSFGVARTRSAVVNTPVCVPKEDG